MSGLRILRIDEARSEAIEPPDVYFSPEYGTCVEASDDAIWEVAVWEPGPILYPYLRRKVAHEGTEDYWDAISPYGYAGAWGAETVGLEQWQRFRAAFREYCRDNNVVSEFIRFHTLLAGRESLCSVDTQIIAVKQGTTLSVDLSDGHEAAWTRYQGRTRTSVRKARKSGYEVRVRRAADVDTTDRQGFRALYEGTMRQVNARPYYLFNDSYYERLWSGLQQNLLLGEVLSSHGEVVSAALFFVHGNLLHYHLAGSVREHARQGVNNLLLDAAVAWGADNGVSRFHLGGGLSEDDALFKFKAAIGREQHEFWTGQCILIPEKYEALVRSTAAMRAVEPQVLLESGYFPAYRTPQPVAEPPSEPVDAQLVEPPAELTTRA